MGLVWIFFPFIWRVWHCQKGTEVGKSSLKCPPLLSLFTDNQEVIVSGTIYLKVAALIGPIYPVFFITTAVFQAVKKPLYSLYLSILRLTAFPFLSLWYVINIRGGDYEDIFYTIMATNWAMGIAVLIFIGYFLNNVFKQNKTLFSY